MTCSLSLPFQWVVMLQRRQFEVRHMEKLIYEMTRGTLECQKSGLPLFKYALQKSQEIWEQCNFQMFTRTAGGNPAAWQSWVCSSTQPLGKEPPVCTSCSSPMIAMQGFVRSGSQVSINYRCQSCSAWTTLRPNEGVDIWAGTIEQHLVFSSLPL